MNKAQRIIDNNNSIKREKEFKEYLKGKDISFWNYLSLPRWTYFLIPVAISATSGDVIGIIIGEFIVLVLLYILYLFHKRKK